MVSSVTPHRRRGLGLASIKYLGLAGVASVLYVSTVPQRSASAAQAVAPAVVAARIDFNRDIRPILSDKCSLVTALMR